MGRRHLQDLTVAPVAGGIGATGPQGPTGPTGPTGPAGMIWRGTWSSATAYVVNDGVVRNGTSYIAVANHTNHDPATDVANTYWNTLAAKGADGSSGTGSGTVSSVGITAPSDITVVGSPVTDSGSITLSRAAQAAKKFLAGPASGADAAPNYRLILPGDVPIMVGSGAGHAAGLVPDPGSGAGTSKFLREDGTFNVPAGAGSPSTDLSPLVPPVAGNFTWFNQGTSTIAVSGNGLRLSVPGAATNANTLRGMVLNAPATPYTVTMAFKAIIRPKDYNDYGIVFRDGAGKSVIYFAGYGGGAYRYFAQKFTNDTTFNAEYMNENLMTPGNLWWLRVTDDGTNRIFSVSADGLSDGWIVLHTVGRTDYLTATQVGFVINALMGTGIPANMNINHWSVA